MSWISSRLLHIHKYFHYYILTLVLFLIATIGSAQEIQLSLNNMNPLFINAANTGNFKGNWRLIADYRNQNVATSDPFRTGMVSFDGKLDVFRQTIGTGLYFINDESGIGGLSYNKVYASLGYQIELNSNYFSIGFQPGYVFASINDWNTWDKSSGSFSAPSGEENFYDNTSYLDLNGGVQWAREIGIFELVIGVNLLHVNKPLVSFFGGDDQEDILTLINTDVKINLTDQLYLQPSLMVVNKSGVNLASFGSRLGYKLLGNKSSVKEVFGGAFIRKGLPGELNALYFTGGVSINRIDIGVAYDLNLGSFNQASGAMGAFEIAFIYRSVSTVLNSYSIPCERY